MAVQHRRVRCVATDAATYMGYAVGPDSPGGTEASDEKTGAADGNELTSQAPRGGDACLTTAHAVEARTESATVSLSQAHCPAVPFPL